jgi:hypothetical protein
MGNEPPKHHPYLSANSVRLRQDDRQRPSIRNMLILLNVVLVLVVCASLLWMAYGPHTGQTQFKSAVVQEDGFKFSVLFYKDAALQVSRDKNYLIMRDAAGQEVMLWATKIDEELGCGTKPSLSYSPQRSTTILSGCYEDDYKTYATAVRVDSRLYQINMTGEKPISTDDAERIFGSVVITAD